MDERVQLVRNSRRAVITVAKDCGKCGGLGLQIIQRHNEYIGKLLVELCICGCAKVEWNLKAGRKREAVTT